MNSSFADLLVMLRAEFCIAGDWTSVGLASIQALQVPFTRIVSQVGKIAPSRCILDNGNFDFSRDGEDCLVFEVLSDDDETVIDLCAFSTADPSRFGTGTGRAILLGEANVRNPASWAWGKALPIRRSPLAWLRAGCTGVVILDHRYAPVILREAPGRLLAEDEQHARELRLMLSTPAVPEEMIVHPGTSKSSKRRAA